MGDFLDTIVMSVDKKHTSTKMLLDAVKGDKILEKGVQFELPFLVNINPGYILEFYHGHLTSDGIRKYIGHDSYVRGTIYRPGKSLFSDYKKGMKNKEEILSFDGKSMELLEKYSTGKVFVLGHSFLKRLGLTNAALPDSISNRLLQM